MNGDNFIVNRSPNEDSVNIMITEINALNDEAWTNRRNSTYMTAKLAALALSLAQYAHYDQGIGEAYLNLSIAEGYHGNIDRAFEFAEKAIAIFEQLSYSVGLIRACNVFGYLYIIRSELGKAFEYLLRGLHLSKSHAYKEMLLFFYFNIGEIYKNTLYLYNEALAYLLESLPHTEESPDHPLCGLIFASIGFCYQKLGNSKQAQLYAGRAIQVAERNVDQQTLSICYHLIANIYKEAGEYELALSYVNKELVTLSTLNDSYSNANCSLTISQIYYALDDYSAAINESLKGLSIVDTYGYAALTYHFYLVLAQCYEKTGSYEKSVDYYKRFVTAYEKTMTLELENRITVLSAELRQEEHLRALSLTMQNEKMSALADIVTGVAHEINTPLGNAISIASYMADLKKELCEELPATQLSPSAIEEFLDNQQDALDMLQQSLRRTANIVDSFKDVAMNRHALDQKTFCLCTLLEDLNTILQPELRAQQVHLEIICDPNLIITSYEELLRYILTHLFQNALLHAFERTSEPMIRVTAVRHPNYLYLSVYDNGIGIDAAHIGKIYNPFFTTKKANGGIGLGLNIVYNMVTQLMNGKIEVKSDSRNGTTFELYFPDKVMS